MSPRPTAVMAVNDLTAVGVMKGLVSAGLRIPQDISVTGFDKTRLAEYSNPSITTVDIHRDLLGQMAADALHALCSSPNPQGREYEVSRNWLWEILRDPGTPSRTSLSVH